VNILTNPQYNHLFSNLTNIDEEENEENFLKGLPFVKNAEVLIGILEKFDDITIIEGFINSDNSDDEFKNTFRHCSFKSDLSMKKIYHLVDKLAEDVDIKEIFVNDDCSIELVIN